MKDWRYKVWILAAIVLLLSGCRKDGSPYFYDISLDEPPRHPFLADSPWPISHKNTYAQASSMLPGPTRISNLTVRHFEPGLPGLITMAISGEYPGGKRVIWGNVITHVFKAEDTGGKLKFITALQKEGASLGSIFDVNNALSGAYTLVDREGIFYTPSGYKLYAYGDAVPGDPYSDIREYFRYEVPGHLREVDERIVGLTMTYDGFLVYATNNGVVGLLDRQLNALAYYEFSEADEISNSIACDEDGGIYIVTSKKMYRVQWTGSVLTTDESLGGWEADYETGEGAGGIRLGEGSGATPTLMGVDGQDKFVVITDGQELMHIVLLWRDKIPDDWQQIPGTKDRRIAAQVPVTFGNPSATRSLSEQSVCVRGYGALVVNNQLKNSANNTLLDLLLSGIPENAPYGAEKFVWNPQTRKLHTAWVNRSVSFPNGIPCMSAKTNMVYNIGQMNGVWTFDALNWSTGQFVFRYRLGNHIKFNSAYAPTEIGMNGAIYSGTLFGMVGMWE